VVMSPRSAIGWIAMYAKIMFKHKGNLPVMSYYRSGKIVIKCAEPVATQIDGDPSGEATDVTIQVQPRSLLVRVAESTGNEGAAADSSGPRPPS
jgi:diacylglycerol kinase (ATP)